eukprot:IDg22440t1
MHLLILLKEQEDVGFLPELWHLIFMGCPTYSNINFKIIKKNRVIPATSWESYLRNLVNPLVNSLENWVGHLYDNRGWF